MFHLLGREARVDLIAFIETHLTLIASLVAVMASLGSVYMVADRRWCKLESSVGTMQTAITTEIATVSAKIDAHSKLFDEHARVEQGWMSGIDQHLRTLNGHVFDHHEAIGNLKGRERNGT